MADAEKQNCEERSSRVRFFLLSCMTIALLSLCICVVLFERETFSPYKYSNIVVLDYAEDEAKVKDRMFDELSNAIHVDFESLEADNEDALNAALRNIASSRSKLNGNDVKKNDETTSADGEKYQVLYDISPSTFKNDQVEQFGVLLQTLMNRPKEEFAFEDIMPLLTDVNETVDLVFVMSRPAQDGIGLPERIRISEASVGKKPAPDLIQPNVFPHDILSSFMRGNYRQPNPEEQSEKLLPTLQQQMEDAKRLMASVQRDYLARQRQKQSTYEEERTSDEQRTSDDLRTLIEQGLSEDQRIFGEKLLREEQLSFIEHMVEQRVAEGANVVDPVETVSSGVKEPFEVVPVMQIRYEEINNATQRSLVDGEKLEEGLTSVQTEEQTEGSGISLSSKSVEKSEQNDSSLDDTFYSLESKEQDKTIPEGHVEQIVIMPAVHTEVKTDSTTGLSEVNVVVSSAEPIPAPPVKKQSFIDKLIKGFAEKTRSIIMG